MMGLLSLNAVQSPCSVPQYCCAFGDSSAVQHNSKFWDTASN